MCKSSARIALREKIPADVIRVVALHTNMRRKSQESFRSGGQQHYYNGPGAPYTQPTGSTVSGPGANQQPPPQGQMPYCPDQGQYTPLNQYSQYGQGPAGQPPSTYTYNVAAGAPSNQQQQQPYYDHLPPHGYNSGAGGYNPQNQTQGYPGYGPGTGAPYAPQYPPQAGNTGYPGYGAAPDSYQQHHPSYDENANPSGGWLRKFANSHTGMKTQAKFQQVEKTLGKLSLTGHRMKRAERKAEEEKKREGRPAKLSAFGPGAANASKTSVALSTHTNGSRRSQIPGTSGRQ